MHANSTGQEGTITSNALVQAGLPKYQVPTFETRYIAIMNTWLVMVNPSLFADWNSIDFRGNP
ncbi:hypothetical protein [Dankookia sp. GCM10030260]|uniref:hypothetical protein n=1 Tax=Dankookia sp. GCM10030260 TaxID=3273390 RepID=UPI0036D38D1F